MPFVSKLYSIDDSLINEYGTTGGMKIDRETRNIPRKPSPGLLCPPLNPHDLTWDQKRAAVVGTRRITP